MKIKSVLTLFWIWLFSLSTMVIGFFMHTILIPIQDFHLLSEVEVAQAQRQYAINYPLGTVLMWLGVILLILTSIILIVSFVKAEIQRRASITRQTGRENQ